MKLEQFSICECSEGEFMIYFHAPKYKTTGRFWWKKDILIDDEFRLIPVNKQNGFNIKQSVFDSLSDAEEALSRMINSNNEELNWMPKFFIYNKSKNRYIEQD